MITRFGRRAKAAAAAPTARVVFELDVDTDGWPPVGSERVWAFDLGNDRYRIDNVPWFVSNIAVGDIVRAIAPDNNSNPVFVGVLQPSNHVTVRVICFRAGPLRGDLQRVIDAFIPLGVYAEGVNHYGMVALDIPPSADLDAIHARLRRGVEDGSWEYDEGRTTPTWERLSH